MRSRGTMLLALLPLAGTAARSDDPASLAAFFAPAHDRLPWKQP